MVKSNRRFLNTTGNLSVVFLAVIMMVISTTAVSLPMIQVQKAFAQSVVATNDSINTQKPEELPPGYVLTPAGPMRADHILKSNGIKSPDIDALAKKFGEKLESVSPEAIYKRMCALLKNCHQNVPLSDGWIESASVPIGQTGAPSSYQYFAGYFKVPEKPTSTYITSPLMTTFVFNDIQSTSHIMQTVLTYGPNGDYGGQYWSLNCWYATSSTGTHGPTISVSVGDVILGFMYQKDRSTWLCGGIDTSTGYSAYYEIPTTDTYQELDNALETYNLSTACADWPGNIEFIDMQVGGGTSWYSPSWQSETWPSHYDSGSCHVGSVTIKSATDVILHVQS